MTKNEEMLFHVFKKYKTVNFVNENNIFYEPSYSILFVDSFSASGTYPTNVAFFKPENK